MSSVGPASFTMLGPELGPDEHLSSKTCHCLFPGVYCLLSLLNSLPKKYVLHLECLFHLKFLLKFDTIQKIQLISI